MGTFLTTPRMPPALAARVEAAVTGKKAGSRRGTVFLRFAAFAAVAGFLVFFAVNRPSCVNDVDQERTVFAREIADATADITEEQRGLVARVTTWLGAHAGGYEGDFIGPEVQGAELLPTLARPMVYVRGTVEELGSTEGIASAAEESFRDAFVFCLYAPPEKRTEKELQRKARASYAGGESPAPNVERLVSALLAQPVIEPSFRTKIDDADSQKAIGSLRAVMKKAQLDVAKRAMRAELLLVLMDEPKEGDRPSELDGSFAHHVRVYLVDLASGKALLRLRKFVDPSWISEGPRVEFAKGINACEVGMDVRATLTPPSPSPPPSSSPSSAPSSSSRPTR